MKKSILVLVLFAFVGCKSAKENANIIVITSKKEVVVNDYEFVINDNFKQIAGKRARLALEE